MMYLRGYEPGDKSDRPDPFKLFYRFFAIAAVILGWLWLAVYKQEIHNVAKLSFVIAGIGWSRVPRLKDYGLGWLVPKFGELSRGQKFFLIISMLFTIFSSSIVFWSGFTLGQAVHWLTGGCAIVAGMDYLMRGPTRAPDEDKQNHE